MTVMFEDLWDSVRSSTSGFDPARVATLPPGARQYLRHAIAPGTPMASTVRLTMHGEIRLQRGYTLPSRTRAGWHCGTERFESEDEFFRVTIDDALFR